MNPSERVPEREDPQLEAKKEIKARKWIKEGINGSERGEWRAKKEGYAESKERKQKERKRRG
jgi:hypothetical protein